jgi:hypothetical protein
VESPQVSTKSYPLVPAKDMESFLRCLSEDKSIPIGIRLLAADILRSLND